MLTGQIKRSAKILCKKMAKRYAKISTRITTSIPHALPHIPKLKKSSPPIPSSKIAKSKPPAPSLIPEILEQIFAHLLSTCTPDAPHLPSPERYDTLFTLSLVAKSWAVCATRLLYKKPFIRRGRYQLEFFLSMLPTEETANLIANNPLTLHHSHPPIFPYPSYIKELDYGKLVTSAWAFCKAGWDISQKVDEKVVMTVRALLKVLLQYQPTIVTLKCTLSTYGFSEKYLQVLDEVEFEDLLKDVDRVYVLGNYQYGEDEKTNILKGLRNVREIKYSCLTPTQTFNISIIDYSPLIIRQKHLQILRIDQAHETMDLIIKAIQFQSDSLIELSFTKCDFQNTDPWFGIANCRKLQRLEFIGCSGIESEVVAPLLAAEWPCLNKMKLVGEKNGSKPNNVCDEFINWASRFNSKLPKIDV